MTKILIDRAVVEQALHVAMVAEHPVKLIAALRAALAEPPVDDPHRDHWVAIAEAAQKIAASTGCGLAEVKALCAALDRLTDAAQAEPVQKPVAKVELMTTGGNAGLATRIVEIDDHLRDRLRPGQLLYTSPLQRKPLTEEEIFKIENDIPDDVIGDRAWTICFARAIERAHKIGGEG